MERSVCCSCYYPPPMRAPCSRRKTFTLTLEPIVCIFLTVQILISRMVYGIFEYKICVTEGNMTSSTFSELISNGTLSPLCRENIVERHFLYYQLIESASAIFPCMFLGSWSDLYGRITLMILPVAGSVVMNCCLMACVLLENATAKLTLLTAIPHGLCGGTAMFMLAVMCYSCDISELCVRTGRISVIYTMGLLGAALGYLLGGTIHDLLAYNPFPIVVATICGCAAILNLMILAYIKLVVVETVHSGLGTYDEGTHFKEIFALENVVRMWNSVVKPRICDARKIIVTLNLVFLLFAIGQYGSNATIKRYLSYMDYNRAELNALNDVSYLLQIIGILLMSAFMWKLGMQETTLGLCGSLLATLGSLMLAIKGSIIEIIGVLIFEFSIFIPLAIVSLLAKLVDTKETGSLFSVLALIQCVLPPCSSLLYREVVPMASSTLIWINFVMSIWIFFCCLVGFGYIHRKMPPEYVEFQDFSERLPLLSRRNITKGAIM